MRAYIEEPDPVPEKPEKEERDPAQEAAAYLKSVLGEMGLPEATVEIRPVEAGAELVLGGDDIGFIIGHRGETLDALQYLASLVANHADGSYFRNHPGRGQLPGEAEGNVGIPGQEDGSPGGKDRPELLFGAHEPYERRIIHTAVQTVAGAKSWSEGVDQGRHVVIGPEGGERPQPRRNDRRGGGRNGGGRGGYNDGRRRPRSDRPRVNPAPRAEGPKTDDPSTPIYGRIEKK